MSRFSRRLLFISAMCCIGIALGLLVWDRPEPPGAFTAPRAAGPDFLRNADGISHPLRIIVYGDIRFTDPGETSATNPKVRRWLVDRIAAEKPDAVLVSGDIPWRGGQASDYDVYRAETLSWQAARLHIYPVLGNHEMYGDEHQCFENWWNAFPELRGRRWYSVQLGDSIYVLNLDSNSSLLPGSEQMAWVQSQLANLPSSVRFVFFHLHYPPVVDVQKNGDESHNGRPNEHALAAFLAQAPQKSRVSFIVAAGHVHNYERFFQQGIVYLISGGGGAKPVPIVRGPQDLYQESEFPNYHYLRFVEDGEKLDATMVRVADPQAPSAVWQEKDHFEVPAAVQPAASKTGSSNP